MLERRAPDRRSLAVAALAAALPCLALPAGAHPAAVPTSGAVSASAPAGGARPPALSAVQQTDTLFLPRSRTAPVLDCSVGEWPAEGRIALSGEEAGVFTARGAGAASDLTARVHLTWTRDTLYVMADVRDDRVRPGTTGGGDWVRVGVGATTVWVPAPGGVNTEANTGPRTIGDAVPTAICATSYGWLGEVAVPADRLGGDLQLGDLVGLQVLAEDPDDASEDQHPPYVRWTDEAVLAAAPERQTPPDSVLDRLREEVTMEELRQRPGARDTTVHIGGETIPAVQVEVAGIPAVAFPDPRSGGTVTYWLEGGEGGPVDDLGLYRTIAALRSELGQWQRAMERERSVFPAVRFELLPGVIFRLGDPGVTGEDVPRSAVPTDVFVRSGSGG